MVSIRLDPGVKRCGRARLGALSRKGHYPTWMSNDPEDGEAKCTLRRMVRAIGG